MLRELYQYKVHFMASLMYDGFRHELSLLDNTNQVVGSWLAYNNVDSRATIKHIRNGIYQVVDRIAPHYHLPNPNGPYGSYGIIRFTVPGHPGIGVHSGRLNAKYKPGPLHATMGCIRTTDEAMRQIKTYMVKSPLTTIKIINNSGSSAMSSTQRNQYRVYHGMRTYLL